MISLRLRKFLDENRVPYETQVHRVAYTAQQVAAEEHVPGRMMAKTVILHTGNGFAMAVLAAPHRVDLAALRADLRSQDVRLATEAEFASLFPDSETGAMPPFGNLYGLPVYADETLAKDSEIVFNAGTHRETIKIKFTDFIKLVRPTMLAISAQTAAA
jgi:Ala-tRNA(Pro) deacylase